MARIRLGLLLIMGAVMLASCLGAAAPLTDDFSDPASGWGAASHETYVRGYQQGRYLIQIDVPRWFVWTTAGRDYEDVTVEVTIRSDEARDNHYGVLCRYAQGAAYYFAISADGYYGIFHWQEGTGLQPLSGRAMLRSPLIRTDGIENRLLAVCEGAQLSLYANGELIAQVEDASLKHGDVGMAAGTLDQGSTIVWFDDLQVGKP